MLNLSKRVWIILGTVAGATLFFFIPLAFGTQIHATSSLGPQRFLVLAVKFPNAQPEKSLNKIKELVLEGSAKYFSEQSYGKTQITGEVKGWYPLPRPMEEYKVRLDDWGEDKKRGRLLVEDALNAADRDVVFDKYDHIIIVLGVSGKAFGMYGYTANPGALSGVRQGKARMVKMTTLSGQTFRGGIILSAEDAHLGQRAVDVAVVLGGVVDRKRVIPMLFDSQKNISTSRGQTRVRGGRAREERVKEDLRLEMRQEWQPFMGPWDLLSCHFVDYDLPPPAMSSFSRLRLGWIEKEQVVEVLPGESRTVTVQPLGNGKGKLVIRIPGPSNTYYLLENRQKGTGDPVLPTTGLLVLHVDESKDDGEGIVRIVDANPKAPYFGAAAFGVKRGQTPSFSLPQNIAVEALWEKDMDLTIMVTQSSKAHEVQSVAKLIRECQRKLKDTETSRGKDLIKVMELLTEMKISEARAMVESFLQIK